MSQGRFAKFLQTIGPVAILASSCSDRVPYGQLTIYGGTPTEEWSSVVAITKGDKLICSGVAITPRLVVTAAHCVGADGAPSDIGIHVGVGREGGHLDVSASAASAAMSPDYGPHPGSWSDIGYFTTREPLPISVDHIAVPLTDQQDIAAMHQVGTPVRLVGFGTRSDGGSGVKHEVETKLTEIHDQEIALGGDGRDACVFDSGGPAMAQSPSGQWHVLALASRGRACGKGGIFTLLASHLCWINADSGVDLGLPHGYCSETMPRVPEDAADADPASAAQSRSRREPRPSDPVLTARQRHP